MRLHELAEVSARLAKTRRRNEKTELLAACFASAQSAEKPLAALYLSGAIRQQKLGMGFAQLAPLRSVTPSETPSLTVREVDASLAAVADQKGAGSSARRASLLQELFARATELEQSFLVRLIMGELRQGALESLVLDAVAKATALPNVLVRRAQMLSGSLVEVVELAFGEGEAGLRKVDIELFRPVQPMLAEPAKSVDEVLDRLGRAAFEVKLDGARVQVHRRGEQVRVYTRGLNEVTNAVPEVVELVRTFTAEELILDGEVIALAEDGSPFPFQETMRRFGRRLDVESLRKELPLSTFFFDCLWVDGRSLLELGTEARASELERVAPQTARVSRIVTDQRESAAQFLSATLARGHEGLMAKALDAPYAAGSRGASWLKLKQSHTLDLVVLAAEWGSGRRTGTLSNLHLGARDPDSGGFVMLGKTFKGLTDELLKFQTEAFLARETHRDAYTVYVRPELVVEIEFNDVQTSPHYPGGVALRFARVKRYRPDKSASEADTIESVRAIWALRSQA